MRVVATTNAKPVDCLTLQHRIVPLSCVRLIFYCLLALELTIEIIARGRVHEKRIRGKRQQAIKRF